MKILKEYLAKGNLTPEDKKFVLRYIVANKNIKQISLATYPDSKSVLTNDLIKTKEYLKNTNQLISWKSSLDLTISILFILTP